MNVVILGCGRSGAMLALQLSSRGHSVTVIDNNPESIRRLGKDYKFKIVLGNGLDTDVLERAEVASCDAFFAMTRGDNTNVMAAQIVKRSFNAERVAVKMADPLRSEVYRKMGFFVINAAALLAGYCRDWLLEDNYDTIDNYNVLVQEMEI